MLNARQKHNISGLPQSPIVTVPLARHLNFMTICLRQIYPTSPLCKVRSICSVVIPWIKVKDVCVALTKFPASPASYPSGFQQLPTKLLRWVVEGEFLTAKVVDRWVAFQVEEQVVVKPDFLRFFLRKGGDPRKEEEIAEKPGLLKNIQRFYCHAHSKETCSTVQ